MLRSALFAFATALVTACGDQHTDDKVAAKDEGLCEAVIERAKKCFEGQFAEQDANDALAECQMRHQAFLGSAREGVEPALSRCIAPLTCEEFDSFDDRCFPEVVADFAEGVIPRETVDACVLNSNTDACEAFLRTREVSAPDVIGECLARHIACADDNDWVAMIDVCVSLALVEAPARDQARDCIGEASCDDVVTCLQQRGALSW